MWIIALLGGLLFGMAGTYLLAVLPLETKLKEAQFELDSEMKWANEYAGDMLDLRNEIETRKGWVLIAKYALEDSPTRITDALDALDNALKPELHE